MFGYDMPESGAIPRSFLFPGYGAHECGAIPNDSRLFGYPVPECGAIPNDSRSFGYGMSESGGIPRGLLSIRSMLRQKNRETADFIEKSTISRFFKEWSRRESNPCPKANPPYFYYHSQLFPKSPEGPLISHPPAGN